MAAALATRSNFERLAVEQRAPRTSEASDGYDGNFGDLSDLPPLESAVRAIEQVFPRCSLGFFPTPLAEMKRLSRRLAGPHLWIKRDDLRAGVRRQQDAEAGISHG
jgi:hypothetical protein